VIRHDTAAQGRAAANALAVERLISAKPVLVDIRPASAVIAGLEAHDILHAGPPLKGWGEAGEVLRGSIAGTLVLHGRANTLDIAQELVASGAVTLRPANDCSAAATYAGVLTRDTKVFVVEDEVSGSVSVAAINEGRGAALRYGCNDAETLRRLSWLEGNFADLLGAAIRLTGGVDLFDILRQALHMGDEGHSRQKAASLLFAAKIAPYLAEVGASPEEAVQVLHFLASNEIFFLPLTMAACKTATSSAAEIENSSLVTCMCSNGTRFGIKVSGTGDRWFTAPAPEIEGHYFERFDAGDATTVIGDSEIAETMGLGAFSMAAAPALARFLGGSVSSSLRLSEEMYAITSAEHPDFHLPYFDFRGTPTGIDVSKVVSAGIEPVFSTGIAHRKAGIGQIGAGLGRAPISCFAAALEALSRRSQESE
jgi:hypothetical protein